MSAGEAKREAGTARVRAEKYKDDPEAAEKLLRDAHEKARRHKGPISGRMDDLSTLTRLVGAYFKREYREVPWETVALAVGALIYFVSPIDLIPDFFPVAGLTDDAAVIAFVVSSLASDLAKFREWEQGRVQAA